MDPTRAIEIVKQLADGVDPTTGQHFPPNSPYQQADTVRALYLALDGLDRLKRVKERQGDGPPKAGRPWTKDEEARMLQQFDAKVDVAAIAQELNRTSGAIWARLEKVGRIQRKDYPGAPKLYATPRPAMPPPDAESPSHGKDDPLPF